MQDQVDLVALGRAKRKIQQIVDAARQRKRQSTRTRIARWDTAGKPTHQIADGLESGNKALVTTTKEPVPTTPLLLSGDDNEWEIGYASFRHADTLPADEEQVQNG